MQTGRRWIFVVCASTIPVLVVGVSVGAYLVGVKHYELSMARAFFRADFVRAYLLDPKFHHLANVLAGQRAAEPGRVATIWDQDSGVLLSRTLFTDVDMWGVQKYSYKPNLTKLMFRFRRAGLDWPIEAPDTPELRAALQDIDTERLVTASYDEFGLRRVDAELTRDCEARVLFLGDSFTDGMWVGDSETFVNRYGHVARDRSRVRVCPVNAGVNGYSSLEEAYVLEHTFEKVGRPKVVILMYFANDVSANYDEVINGTLVGAESKWRESLSYVRRAAAFARRHGSTLVVAAIPSAEQLSQPATRKNYQNVLRRFCEAEKIPFVDLLARLESFDVDDVYLDWDPHFTSRGHQIVAEILFQETQSLLGAS